MEEQLKPAIKSALKNRAALLDVVVTPEAASSDAEAGCLTCNRSPQGMRRSGSGGNQNL
jgi:hypothetical protein